MNETTVTSGALSDLENLPPWPGDMAFKLDGMSADEYIEKLTKEMNSIDFDSIPFDKWDYILVFSLALMEVAGDFFIGDPQFKHSLANKNGTLVQWMKQAHDNPPNWLKHDAQPLDWQGKIKKPDGSEVTLMGGKGDHRATTFAHDLLCFPLGIISLCRGEFIDCVFTKDGVYELICEAVNQNGKAYATMDVGQATISYLLHMVADFCSASSLPIPGFSLLTHFPNRDIEALALKLYRNGMNLRTMLLQGVPVAAVEFLTWLYVELRYKDSSFGADAIKRKKDKLLLITHGITSAVNIGKVIISKNPARLNLILVARTFYLVWKVVTDEMKLTNMAIEKLDIGIMRSRIESMQTLILLDKTIYMTSQYERLISESKQRVEELLANQKMKQEKFSREFDDIFNEIK